MGKNANQVIQRLCLKPDQFPWDHIKVPPTEEAGSPLHRALEAEGGAGVILG